MSYSSVEDRSTFCFIHWVSETNVPCFPDLLVGNGPDCRDLSPMVSQKFGLVKKQCVSEAFSEFLWFVQELTKLICSRGKSLAICCGKLIGTFVWRKCWSSSMKLRIPKFSVRKHGGV